MEHRSALSPKVVQELKAKGFAVNVEKSPERIFDDSEFENFANLVPEGSWRNTPEDHLIIGLKELPEEEFPCNYPLAELLGLCLFDNIVRHTHIQFAHCYKGQEGWERVLSRFPQGGGTLYDLEFLENDQKRRIAAFGYHAG